MNKLYLFWKNSCLHSQLSLFPSIFVPVFQLPDSHSSNIHYNAIYANALSWYLVNVIETLLPAHISWLAPHPICRQRGIFSWVNDKAQAPGGVLPSPSPETENASPQARAPILGAGMVADKSIELRVLESCSQTWLLGILC